MLALEDGKLRDSGWKDCPFLASFSELKVFENIEDRKRRCFSLAV